MSHSDYSNNSYPAQKAPRPRENAPQGPGSPLPQLIVLQEDDEPLTTQPEGDQQSSPQQSQPQGPRKRNPHLYFLNPCSLLGVLAILLSIGMISRYPLWTSVSMQTLICLIVLAPLLTFVTGLIWGVMNPQCRPVRFLQAACMGVCIGRLFTQTAPFLFLFRGVAAGFAGLCVCFLFSWLGTRITNAIFHVDDRMRSYLPDPKKA